MGGHLLEPEMGEGRDNRAEGGITEGKKRSNSIGDANSTDGSSTDKLNTNNCLLLQ